MRGRVGVPAAPFRKIIEDRIAQLEAAEDEAPIQQISFETGLAEITIYEIRSLRRKEVEFPTADTVVTKILGPMAWHSDPELREIYTSTDFVYMDLLFPLDNDVARAEANERILEAWDANVSKNAAAKALGIDHQTFSKRLKGALEAAGRDPGEAKKRQNACHDRDLPQKGKVFYGGAWRTQEAVERHRQNMRRTAVA